MKKSFFYGHHSKERNGIAMIMAVGALSVITIVTLGFSFNMQAQYKISLNYLNALKVRYIAESGVERAVANLKEDAKARFAYEKSNLNNVSGDWNTNSAITDMTLGGGKYSITVEDEQSKININTASQALLTNIGFTTLQASDIAAYITANGLFTIVEELKKISSIDADTYNKVAGYLTVNSYRDPNCSGWSPVNVNTAPDNVLSAVVKCLGNGSISDLEVDGIVSSIKTNRPIADWDRFNEAVDGALSDLTKREAVKNNCNPNRNKTGLTYATTEFCFFSGGHYTIISTGTIGKSTSRVKTIVKLYDIMNESTSADFSGGTFTNVNINDLCPVGPGVIPNSLKIGYYDDFFGSNKEWVLSPGASINSDVLTTLSGGGAELSSTGNYTVTTADLIYVEWNGNSSGFVKAPYTFYDSGLPLQASIKANLIGNKLQLVSTNCTATWDNLRILTGSGVYITRQYSVSDVAEQPVSPVIYGTVTKADTADGSDVTISFANPSPDKVQIRADFANPGLASTAAVLEDIWFTYLPKAKFLYRQEG